ncbi:MAG TPA: alpha/beta fold hydrolase [Microthrixaceae bacterium]|mgnify:CR=1 FL=1|jgi:2-succinyl-6-hydroxy-2,4-cyclohexadiene-1-carboxylate synthase|nr:alpha/beta fold hydrolase [Microthrixaceae bacterium]
MPTPLAATRTGAGPHPVVLVHGFTQTGRCWGPLGDSLALRGEVLALDAPGHGGSGELRLDLADAAAAIAATVERADSRMRRPLLIGYSMGARMALHAVLHAPAAFSGLVLISATPGIDDDAERSERRRRDDALADHIEAVGCAQFIDEWLALPMFATLPASAAHRDERVRNSAAGLAASLRLAGTGRQAPLWNDLASIDLPVLVLTGSLDTKFDAIGRRTATAIGPNAVARTIDGAGHTVHLEAPDATSGALAAWIDEISG